MGKRSKHPQPNSNQLPFGRACFWRARLPRRDLMPQVDATAGRWRSIWNSWAHSTKAASEASSCVWPWCQSCVHMGTRMYCMYIDVYTR